MKTKEISGDKLLRQQKKREKEIAGSFEWMKDARFKNQMELFEDFYTQIRGEEMDETYRGIIQDVVKEVT